MTMTNEFAPTPMSIEDSLNYSPYPQLMATPWSSNFIGGIFNIQLTNEYGTLEDGKDEP